MGTLMRKRQRARLTWRALGLAGLLLLPGCGSGNGDGGEDAIAPPDWGQWARDPSHTGRSPVIGQPLARVLADLVYDPLAPQVVTASGAVYIHYQAPLVAGDDLFMTFKSGTVASPSWSVKRLRFANGRQEDRWTFGSDWRPVPGLTWEPVFHPALAGGFLYVPAASGGVFKLDPRNGQQVARITPFGTVADTFVAGPLSVAPDGSILYNTLTLDLAAPWTSDARGSALVRVTADDRAVSVSYARLIPAAPAPDAPCELQFDNADLPWPPSPGARPPTAPCGTQRPGVNVAPAIGPNGVLVTISRAHLNTRYGYLVALNPDLTLRWASSLRDHLSDGCGSSLLPPNGAPGGCREGARQGVDPATNAAPAGRVLDLSTSSPVIAPDGSVLYGAYTRYNGSRGHLMHFDSGGRFLRSFDFGWDVTPALHVRAAGWSAILKDNDYGAGSYCDVPSVCPRGPLGPFRLVQLSPELVPEWRSDPAPDEWCINAPAVDAEGTVFALNEDGHLYAIRQGGAVRDRIMLARAVGAAYTPLAIGGDGRIFALNYGRLFVVGR